jgi:hypothetical protein
MCGNGPPDDTDAGAGIDGALPPDAGPPAMGAIGPSGGKLPYLHFAIVGDTRPPSEDDTQAYPTAIIQQIWQDIAAESPVPPFAITTGDYMFANPRGSESNRQLDLYLGARAAFPNEVFAAMGNHECTGAVASNCAGGYTTNNFDAFMQRMIAPLGQSKPYYTVHIDAMDGSWTSKFVIIAANAWSSDQESWFDNEMAQATTYTFVVRHEGSYVSNAPGVTASSSIMSRHPYTLLVAGHSHTFAFHGSSREVIVGNGGAPLTGGSVGYGYAIAIQRGDGTIELDAKNYSTKSVFRTSVVKADGTLAQ